MRQLFIDSRDRVSGSPQNFSIQLRDTLTTTASNYFRLDSIRIPLVIPRIQTGVNDQIYFIQGVVPTPPAMPTVRVCTLVQGTYSGSDMATMIQKCLHDQHPEGPNPEVTDDVWQVTYSYTTAGMSIAALQDATFYILNDSECLKYTSAAVPCTRSFCSTLFQDANGGVTTTTTSQPGFIGGGVSWNFPFVSMVPCDLVYIASNQLSSNDAFGPSGSCNCLAALVTNSDFASVLSQSMPAEVWLPCPTMSTQQLDFQVRDRNYNLLTSLPNWSMVVTIR